MGYCSESDVAALNAQRKYTATSKPTSSQVNTMIDHVAALMDARLGVLGFTVPVVSASKSLNLLKIINTLGAASMAEEAIYYDGSEAQVVRKPKYQDLWQRYEAEMKRIEANPLLLSDATWAEVTEDRPAVGELTSYPQENPGAEGLAPRFEMGERF